MYEPSEQVIAWGKAHGFNVHAHCEYFNDYLANRTRKPYKDLDAAFRQCVRSDWGRIRFLMTKSGTYWPKQDKKESTYQAPPPVEDTPELVESRSRALAMVKQLADKMVVS
jgi:hypothetical protein